MANTGRHTNGSQFYITMRELPGRDGANVAFGRVMKGWTTLTALDEAETDLQRPIEPMVVADCGLL